MSWNINVIGKSEDVKAAVAKTDLPQPLKDVVNLFADAGSGMPDPNKPAVRLKTFGHYGASDSWSNVGEFVIERVTLAPPAQPGPANQP